MPTREAVVDGDCGSPTSSSSIAATAGRRARGGSASKQGDRVATIAPNTHAHLEQFYAVPQIGAVIVPMNYRLTAEDFVYIAEPLAARRCCACTRTISS